MTSAADPGARGTADDGAHFPLLFAPLRVGPIEVPNRICETTNSIGAGATPGFPDDAFIAHHVAKARAAPDGSAARRSCSTPRSRPRPPTSSSPERPPYAFPLYAMPGFVEQNARYIDAVHEAGSVAVCQLTHLNHTVAASSVPLVEAYDWVPHSLDDAEIHQIIATYAAAAAALSEAGADGIEIHCAHETLPQSFLSPALNLRTDRWGGDAEARTRFVTEVVTAVRSRIGDGLAIGLRICGMEHREGDTTSSACAR